MADRQMENFAFSHFMNRVWFHNEGKKLDSKSAELDNVCADNASAVSAARRDVLVSLFINEDGCKAEFEALKKFERDFRGCNASPAELLNFAEGAIVIRYAGLFEALKRSQINEEEFSSGLSGLAKELNVEINEEGVRAELNKIWNGCWYQLQSEEKRDDFRRTIRGRLAERLVVTAKGDIFGGTLAKEAERAFCEKYGLILSCGDCKTPHKTVTKVIAEADSALQYVNSNKHKEGKDLLTKQTEINEQRLNLVNMLREESRYFHDAVIEKTGQWTLPDPSTVIIRPDEGRRYGVVKHPPITTEEAKGILKEDWEAKVNVKEANKMLEATKFYFWLKRLTVTLYANVIRNSGGGGGGGGGATPSQPTRPTKPPFPNDPPQPGSGGGSGGGARSSSGGGSSWEFGAGVRVVLEVPLVELLCNSEVRTAEFVVDQAQDARVLADYERRREVAESATELEASFLRLRWAQIFETLAQKNLDKFKNIDQKVYQPEFSGANRAHEQAMVQKKNSLKDYEFRLREFLTMLRTTEAKGKVFTNLSKAEKLRIAEQAGFTVEVLEKILLADDFDMEKGLKISLEQLDIQKLELTRATLDRWLPKITVTANIGIPDSTAEIKISLTLYNGGKHRAAIEDAEIMVKNAEQFIKDAGVAAKHKADKIFRDVRQTQSELRGRELERDSMQTALLKDIVRQSPQGNERATWEDLDKTMKWCNDAELSSIDALAEHEKAVWRFREYSKLYKIPERTIEKTLVPEESVSEPRRIGEGISHDFTYDATLTQRPIRKRIISEPETKQAKEVPAKPSYTTTEMHKKGIESYGRDVKLEKYTHVKINYEKQPYLAQLKTKWQEIFAALNMRCDDYCFMNADDWVANVLVPYQKSHDFTDAVMLDRLDLMIKGAKWLNSMSSNEKNEKDETLTYLQAIMKIKDSSGLTRPFAVRFNRHILGYLGSREQALISERVVEGKKTTANVPKDYAVDPDVLGILSFFALQQIKSSGANRETGMTKGQQDGAVEAMKYNMAEALPVIVLGAKDIVNRNGKVIDYTDAEQAMLNNGYYRKWVNPIDLELEDAELFRHNADDERNNKYSRLREILKHILDGTLLYQYGDQYEQGMLGAVDSAHYYNRDLQPYEGTTENDGTLTGRIRSVDEQLALEEELTRKLIAPMVKDEDRSIGLQHFLGELNEKNIAGLRESAVLRDYIRQREELKRKAGSTSLEGTEPYEILAENIRKELRLQTQSCLDGSVRYWVPYILEQNPQIRTHLFKSAKLYGEGMVALEKGGKPGEEFINLFVPEAQAVIRDSSLSVAAKLAKLDEIRSRAKDDKLFNLLSDSDVKTLHNGLCKLFADLERLTGLKNFKGLYPGFSRLDPDHMGVAFYWLEAIEKGKKEKIAQGGSEEDAWKELEAFFDALNHDSTKNAAEKMIKAIERDDNLNFNSYNPKHMGYLASLARRRVEMGDVWMRNYARYIPVILRDNEAKTRQQAIQDAARIQSAKFGRKFDFTEKGFTDEPEVQGAVLSWVETCLDKELAQPVSATEDLSGETVVKIFKANSEMVENIITLLEQPEVRKAIFMAARLRQNAVKGKGTVDETYERLEEVYRDPKVGKTKEEIDDYLKYRGNVDALVIACVKDEIHKKVKDNKVKEAVREIEALNREIANKLTDPDTRENIVLGAEKFRRAVQNDTLKGSAADYENLNRKFSEDRKSQGEVFSWVITRLKAIPGDYAASWNLSAGWADSIAALLSNDSVRRSLIIAARLRSQAVEGVIKEGWEILAGRYEMLDEEFKQNPDFRGEVIALATACVQDKMHTRISSAAEEIKSLNIAIAEKLTNLDTRKQIILESEMLRATVFEKRFFVKKDDVLEDANGRVAYEELNKAFKDKKNLVSKGEVFAWVTARLTARPVTGPGDYEKIWEDTAYWAEAVAKLLTNAKTREAILVSSKLRKEAIGWNEKTKVPQWTDFDFAVLDAQFRNDSEREFRGMVIAVAISAARDRFHEGLMEEEKGGGENVGIKTALEIRRLNETIASKLTNKETRDEIIVEKEQLDGAVKGREVSVDAVKSEISDRDRAFRDDLKSQGAVFAWVEARLKVLPGNPAGSWELTKNRAKGIAGLLLNPETREALVVSAQLRLEAVNWDGKGAVRMISELKKNKRNYKNHVVICENNFTNDSNLVFRGAVIGLASACVQDEMKSAGQIIKQSEMIADILTNKETRGEVIKETELLKEVMKWQRGKDIPKLNDFDGREKELDGIFTKNEKAQGFVVAWILSRLSAIPGDSGTSWKVTNRRAGAIAGLLCNEDTRKALLSAVEERREAVLKGAKCEALDWDTLSTNLELQGAVLALANAFIQEEIMTAEGIAENTKTVAWILKQPEIRKALVIESIMAQEILSGSKVESWEKYEERYNKQYEQDFQKRTKVQGMVFGEITAQLRSIKAINRRPSYDIHVHLDPTTTPTKGEISLKDYFDRYIKIRKLLQERFHEYELKDDRHGVARGRFVEELNAIGAIDSKNPKNAESVKNAFRMLITKGTASYQVLRTLMYDPNTWKDPLAVEDVLRRIRVKYYCWEAYKNYLEKENAWVTGDQISYLVDQQKLEAGLHGKPLSVEQEEARIKANCDWYFKRCAFVQRAGYETFGRGLFFDEINYYVGLYMLDRNSIYRSTLIEKLSKVLGLRPVAWTIGKVKESVNKEVKDLLKDKSAAMAVYLASGKEVEADPEAIWSETERLSKGLFDIKEDTSEALAALRMFTRFRNTIPFNRGEAFRFNLKNPPLKVIFEPKENVKEGKKVQGGRIYIVPDRAKEAQYRLTAVGLPEPERFEQYLVGKYGLGVFSKDERGAIFADIRDGDTRDQMKRKEERAAYISTLIKDSHKLLFNNAIDFHPSMIEVKEKRDKFLYDWLMSRSPRRTLDVAEVSMPPKEFIQKLTKLESIKGVIDVDKWAKAITKSDGKIDVDKAERVKAVFNDLFTITNEVKALYRRDGRATDWLEMFLRDIKESLVKSPFTRKVLGSEWLDAKGTLNFIQSARGVSFDNNGMLTIVGEGKCPRERLKAFEGNVVSGLRSYQRDKVKLEGDEINWGIDVFTVNIAKNIAGFDLSKAEASKWNRVVKNGGISLERIKDIFVQVKICRDEYNKANISNIDLGKEPTLDEYLRMVETVGGYGLERLEILTPAIEKMPPKEEEREIIKRRVWAYDGMIQLGRQLDNQAQQEETVLQRADAVEKYDGKRNDGKTVTKEKKIKIDQRMIVYDREYDIRGDVKAKGALVASAVLLSMILGLIYLTVSSHLFHCFRQKNTLKRDVSKYLVIGGGEGDGEDHAAGSEVSEQGEKGGKTSGKSLGKSAGWKFFKENPPIAKQFFYYLGLILLETGLLGFLAYAALDWSNLIPVFVVPFYLLPFAFLLFGAAMITIDRLTTKLKSPTKPDRKDYSLESKKQEGKNASTKGGIPADRSTLFILTTMANGGTFDDFIELVEATFRNCRDRKNGNISIGIFQTGGHKDDELDRQTAIIEALRERLSHEGVLTGNAEVFYFVRSKAARMDKYPGEADMLFNRDKKYSGLCDILNFLGEGVIRPDTDYQRYVPPIHKNYFVGFGSFLVTCVTFVATLSSWLAGLGPLYSALFSLGMFFSATAVVIVLGAVSSFVATKLDKKRAETVKRIKEGLVMDRVNGDLRKLGFMGIAPARDPKKDDAHNYSQIIAASRAKGQEGANRIKLDPNKKVWAAFLLDEKNGAGIPEARQYFFEEAAADYYELKKDDKTWKLYVESVLRGEGIEIETDQLNRLSEEAQTDVIAKAKEKEKQARVAAGNWADTLLGSVKDPAVQKTDEYNKIVLEMFSVELGIEENKIREEVQESIKKWIKGLEAEKKALGNKKEKTDADKKEIKAIEDQIKNAWLKYDKDVALKMQKKREEILGDNNSLAKLFEEECLCEINKVNEAFRWFEADVRRENPSWGDRKVTKTAKQKLSEAFNEKCKSIKEKHRTWSDKEIEVEAKKELAKEEAIKRLNLLRKPPGQYRDKLIEFYLIRREARERDPMYDPVRKAVEIMDHPSNEYQAFGTPHIAVLGDAPKSIPGLSRAFSNRYEKATQFGRIANLAQTMCAFFERSMFLNVGEPSFYGKGLVVIDRWLKAKKEAPRQKIAFA
ncbi:MAG: hypothetical protein PHE61_05275, partial [Candidatus Omnitrophica bacterium]|nr:hypothetical protein [Candidatus Omnitrophota bacterium]